MMCPRSEALPLRRRYSIPKVLGSKTEVICKAMKNQGHYHHLRVDWVGESSTQSITLCGVEGEDIGTDTLPQLRPGSRCPECFWVGTGEPARVI